MDSPMTPMPIQPIRKPSAIVDSFWVAWRARRQGCRKAGTVPRTGKTACALQGAGETLLGKRGRTLLKTALNNLTFHG